MAIFQTRLFFRIIRRSPEAYFLKIITLAIAFACSTLIILFSINEFGYDRFHRNHHSVFRILQRNNQEPYDGNRLSNRIPPAVFSALGKSTRGSIVLSRVKVMNELNIATGARVLLNQKLYTADAEIADIFSFEVVDGSLRDFRQHEGTAILSASTAENIFGPGSATGRKLEIYTFGDTVHFSVAAVYKDHPRNAHEEFNGFLRFDTASIRSLKFDPYDAGVYARIQQGDPAAYESILHRVSRTKDLTYSFQPVAEIYFGPRVLGEEARHGDGYSIIILIGITGLILFLALTTSVNLTTLTLPYRSKELAVKKLAGTSQWNLILAFAKESFFIAGSSLAVGLIVLALTSAWVTPLVSIDPILLLLEGNLFPIFILVALLLIFGTAPLFMTHRFTSATPIRLLGSDTITFPRFKRMITFLQLGVSIFLIVAAMVIKRQINFSLLKEPGRNHDQVVYLRYPKGLTGAGLAGLKKTWKEIHPNIVDLIATSQLPHSINSRELNSPFYFMSVDRDFRDFFALEMLAGNWFKANDGDSIVVINEQGKDLVGSDGHNVIGVFRDMSGQFNQPAKPIKVNVAPHFKYNFLCIRILEVDIRRTVGFLSGYFQEGGQKAEIRFMNKGFAEWLLYQDRLNMLSGVLAIISGVLSCCAIYGLTISIVRDKLKQIAIHKLFGANIFHITRLLVREFAEQMLWVILFFGPLIVLIMQELLRNFVYSTGFHWSDPLFPLAYCALVIVLLCGFQALSLRRGDLTAALKG